MTLNSRPFRVLIVEDAPLNLELTTDLLKRAGYTVLSAITAEKGINLARLQQPDLILMDIGLPGMDGIEATRQLKGHPITARIPVVALTAHALPSDEEKARAAGCVGYLTKPLDTRTLANYIAGFLPGRQQERHGA